MLKMEVPDLKVPAKMELSAVVSDLMPAGKPKFLEVVKFPKITDLVRDHGRAKMHKVIFLMVKDFCSSINVVRNMNEDQMIEAAGMLLDEADNFRLEDYTMFFSMAKRGQLGEVRDRIDLPVISAFLDQYWLKRQEAAFKTEEEPIKHYDSLGNTARHDESLNPQDKKLMDMTDNLSGMIGDMKASYQRWKEEGE